MILGLSVSTFTLLHVIISLIGIATGFIVVYGLLTRNTLANWTGVFLITTVLTSATGYFFHRDMILPSHIVGGISLAVLAVALLALYVFRLNGAWRWIYIVTALFALYLNVFVGVIQAFLKIDALKALAPTQTEPPFVIAQAAVLGLFVVIGIVSLLRFRPMAMAPA